MVVNAALGTHNSQRILIQYNEVARTKCGAGIFGAPDGDGIDLGRWTTDSIVQYNFVHNNDGAGIMLGGEGTDVFMPERNVVRYNVRGGLLVLHSRVG